MYTILRSLLHTIWRRYTRAVPCMFQIPLIRIWQGRERRSDLIATSPQRRGGAFYSHPTLRSLSLPPGPRSLWYGYTYILYMDELQAPPPLPLSFRFLLPNTIPPTLTPSFWEGLPKDSSCDCSGYSLGSWPYLMNIDNSILRLIWSLIEQFYSHPPFFRELRTVLCTSLWIRQGKQIHSAPN